MRIITGSTGSTHVTSNDDGEFNQGVLGTDLIVFSNGQRLDASIIDNNTIRVKDGDLVMQGRHALIPPNTTEDVAIETGAVGVNRNDLIVARYVMDKGTGYESITLEVVKGKETAGDAADPDYITGDIRTGSSYVEVPLYRVKITGISITGIDKLFSVSNPINTEIQKLKEENSKLNNALADLNDSGNIESFYIGDDGKPYITYEFDGGTVTKKLGSGIDGDTVPLIEKGVANDGVTISRNSSYCVITYYDGYFTVANNNSTARGVVALDVTEYDYLLIDGVSGSNSYMQVDSTNRYGSRINVSGLTGTQRIYLVSGTYYNLYGVKE